MERLDDIAIITFIACDAVLESIINKKYVYEYYYTNIKVELLDITKRLFR